jgi:hypothetical protein
MNSGPVLRPRQETYPIEEINGYCDIISQLHCPDCGDSSKRLNATKTGTVWSAVSLTKYSRKIKVACPRCLNKANSRALIKTAILGWWSPTGFVNTIRAIVLNSQGLAKNNSGQHTEHMRAFAFHFKDEIVANKDDKDKLMDLVLQVKYM